MKGTGNLIPICMTYLNQVQFALSRVNDNQQESGDITNMSSGLFYDHLAYCPCVRFVAYCPLLITFCLLLIAYGPYPIR